MKSHLITKWVWNWAKYLTPLSFHFLTCEVESTRPTLSSVFKITLPATAEKVLLEQMCFQPKLLKTARLHWLFFFFNNVSKYYKWRGQYRVLPRGGAQYMVAVGICSKCLINDLFDGWIKIASNSEDKYCIAVVFRGAQNFTCH